MARGDNFRGKRPEGSGRKKGQTNRVTADVRAAIAEIVQGNIAAFQDWMEEIEDPKQRCEVFLKLMTFNVPQLQRVESTVRHALAASDMTDAELQAIASGGTSPAADRAGPESRTH